MVWTCRNLGAWSIDDRNCREMGRSKGACSPAGQRFFCGELWSEGGGKAELAAAPHTNCSAKVLAGSNGSTCCDVVKAGKNEAL